MAARLQEGGIQDPRIRRLQATAKLGGLGGWRAAPKLQGWKLQGWKAATLQGWRAAAV